MKHLLRVGVLIAIWGLCGKGHADLYFPHIAVGVNWQSEICVINTSGQKNVTGFLDPYDNAGKRVSQSISINLGPHARQEFPIANVFSNPGSIGYIILVTASNDVCGYTRFFTPGRWRAAVPAVSTANTGQIYIPYIASNVNWWTGISLLNTTSEQKIATIAFNTGQTVPFSLAAREHRVFTIRNLFGGQPQPGIRCATITGASGIIGLELFGSMSASGNSYLGGVLLKDTADTQLDYPHIVNSAEWWTGLAVYNPADIPADVIITPYTQSGASLTSQSIVINGGANFVANTANMNLPEKTAWLRMESATPLAGLELFGTRDGRQMAGYGVVGIGRKEGIFSRLEKIGWTGIALINAEDSTAALTLTAYNDNGDRIAEAPLTLQGREKVVAMPQNLFTDSIAAATYLRYSAGKWIVGFQLNSDGKDLLDGLPTLAAPYETSVASFSNAKPYIDVVVDDVVIDFGRLDGIRRQNGVGPPTAGGLYVQPPFNHPIPFPNLFDAPPLPISLALPSWGVYFPPALVAPWNPGRPPGTAGTALKTLPIINRPAGPGHINPIQNPWGMTVVYAVVADADGEDDWIAARFMLPKPIMGRGNLYAAVDTPEVPVGAIIDTEIKLSYYNQALSDYANLGQLPLQPHRRTPSLSNPVQRFIATTESVRIPPQEFPYIIAFSNGSGGIVAGQTVTEAPNPLGFTPQGQVLHVILVAGSWAKQNAQGYLWLIPVQDDFWDFRHNPNGVPALYVGSVQKAICSFVGQALPIIWEAPDDPDVQNTTHDRRHLNPPGSIIPRGGYISIEARVSDLFDPVEQRDFGLVAYPDPDAVSHWHGLILSLSGPASVTVQQAAGWSVDILGGFPPFDVTFDWGDGTATETVSIDAPPAALAHIYAGEGRYTIRASVTDGLGSSGTASLSVEVRPAVPTLTLAGPGSVDAGQPETWRAAVSGGASPFNFNIDWGDGISDTQLTSTEALDLRHTYSREGRYTIRVTVTDSLGSTDAASLSVEVKPVEPKDCATLRAEYQERFGQMVQKYQKLNCETHGNYSGCALDYGGFLSVIIIDGLIDRCCGDPDYVDCGISAIEEYYACLVDCNERWISRSINKTQLRECANVTCFKAARAEVNACYDELCR